MCGLSLLGACSGNDEADSGGVTDEAAPATVSVPPSRLTPFCQAMIDLSETLEVDPPEDETALIIETYLSVLDDVPEMIEPDFLVVLADLQGEPRPTTTLPASTTSVTLAGSPSTSAAPPEGSTIPVDDESFDAEGRLPDDESVQRLNGYVQSVCRDSANNPGPPATPPVDDLGIEEEQG